jgi:hypothetical protein
MRTCLRKLLRLLPARSTSNEILGGNVFDGVSVLVDEGQVLLKALATVLNKIHNDMLDKVKHARDNNL